MCKLLDQKQISNAKKFTRRSFLGGAITAFVGVKSAIKSAGRQSSSGVYEFVNGYWFDGQKFADKRFYSVGGVLVSKKPDRRTSRIDLTGKFVIPPFGEAHNHNVEYSDRIDQVIRKYIHEGIFYVKNPNNLPGAKNQLAGKINVAAGIDVMFANGGLTASGGHPLGVVRRNLERGAPPSDWVEGGFYFTIDNLADLDRKWRKVLAGKPDFIKTYLQYSEEYEKRKHDDAYLDWRGLDPNLLSEIVRRAHRAGLRVSTHVETATDFHNALVAGVDEINHMPGFRPEKKVIGRSTTLRGLRFPTPMRGARRDIA